MPITVTSVVSREIKTAAFTTNGSLSVTLLVSYDGTPRDVETHEIPAEATAAILDHVPPAGFTFKQAMVASIYEYLLSNNLVVGTVEV